MSRAYRIQVRESLSRVVTAEDHVSTDLELLEILPPEAMSALLEQELLEGGFEKEGDKLVRRDRGVLVAVDPANGKVTVSTEASEGVEVETTKRGQIYDDSGQNRAEVQQRLREQAQEELEKQIDQRQGELQQKATDKLAGALADIKGELDQAVNKVTAEALKQKAASLGHIKRQSEDPETGNLEIVVEV